MRTAGILSITLSAVMLLAGDAWAARTWSDATGNNKVEAEYVSSRDGKVVLRLENDKLATVSLDKLSEADRKYIETVEAGIDPETVTSGTPDVSGDDRLSQALQEDSTNPDNWYNRGLSHANSGNHHKAIEDFNQAIQLDPEHALAYNGRGSSNAALGDPIAAHKDFNRAIELDPNFPYAYKNRGDNLRDLAADIEGKSLIDEELKRYRDGYREKMNAARTKNMRFKGWQPLNSTTANVSPNAALNMMVEADMKKYEDLERRYEPARQVDLSGIGVGGVKIGGVNIGGVNVAGPSVGGAGGTGKGMTGLYVLPEQVTQGELVTISANPAALRLGMPQIVAGEGKPGKGYGKSGEAAEGEGEPNPEDYVEPTEVSFYRDLNGNGVLDDGEDELLATDVDASDGFTAKVSTENFNPGTQTYFAMPKADLSKIEGYEGEGAAGKGKPATGEGSPAEGAPGEGKPAPGEAAAMAAAGAPVSGTGDVLPSGVAASAPGKGGPGGGGKGYGGGDGDGGNTYVDGDDTHYHGDDLHFDDDDDVLVEDRIERAVDHWDDGDYDVALREYDRAVYREPENVYLRRDRANAYLARGGYEYAIRDYNRVLEVEQTADFYYNRGCAYQAAGKLELAKADFLKSIELDETGNLAWNNLGTVQARLGEYRESIAAFEKALAINPNDSLAYRNRALAYKKLGETSKYEADMKRARELETKTSF